MANRDDAASAAADPAATSPAPRSARQVGEAESLTDGGIAALAGRGHSDAVVTRMPLAEYRGSGYARVARDLMPRFAEYGVGVDGLRRPMTKNPARWLTWR